MIHEVVMPQLAMGMSEGIIVEWLVDEGAKVNRDDLVVSIETEKVVTELPAPYDGFLHIIADDKETVPIEKPIAMIASTEDEYQQALEKSAKQEAGPPVGIDESTESAGSSLTAAEAATDGKATRQIKASGVAKKLANDAGIPLEQIAGTGPGGRIVQRDVQVAIDARASRKSEVAEDVDTGRRVRASIPLTGMRGTIAARMLEAKVTAAQTYSFFEIDVTKLLAVRAAMLEREESLGIRVSMVALYAKALAQVCQQVPICNATLEGDEITLWENVDIGMAVALPGRTEYESGLIVPVIRNVESKSVLEISRELKDLVTRARSGELSAADMGNHTVTLSSTAGMSTPGSWSVSAPILNLPAVLAFQPGTPKRSCVVEGDQVAIRDILPCGLTFDHRAMDGEPVGMFGRSISDLLGNPEGWCSVDD
jgi:pyruvate dehydrogenase E2 component (dihydrolipoamide acetyltransferase)